MQAPPRVMIVDDHAPMRATLRSILSSITTNVVEATEGSEAVRLYVDCPFDWVVMDVRMQPMNGLAATAEIRRQHPSAQIVIVTQFDTADIRTAAETAGATGLVSKENLIALLDLLSQGEPARTSQPISETDPRK